MYTRLCTLQVEGYYSVRLQTDGGESDQSQVGWSNGLDKSRDPELCILVVGCTLITQYLAWQHISLLILRLLCNGMAAPFAGGGGTLVTQYLAWQHTNSPVSFPIKTLHLQLNGCTAGGWEIQFRQCRVTG